MYCCISVKADQVSVAYQSVFTTCVKLVEMLKNATVPTHPRKKMTWARLPTWVLPKDGSRWNKCCCRKRPYNSGIILGELFVARLDKDCNSFAAFIDIICNFLLWFPCSFFALPWAFKLSCIIRSLVLPPLYQCKSKVTLRKSKRSDVGWGRNGPTKEIVQEKISLFNCGTN